MGFARIRYAATVHFEDTLDPRKLRRMVGPPASSANSYLIMRNREISCVPGGYQRLASLGE